MTLPFLEPRNLSGSIMSSHGKSDVETSSEIDSPDSKIDPDMKEACLDFMRAIDSRSPRDLMHALTDFLDCWENRGNFRDEDDHEDDHYDSEYNR